MNLNVKGEDSKHLHYELPKWKRGNESVLKWLCGNICILHMPLESTNYIKVK